MSSNGMIERKKTAFVLWIPTDSPAVTGPPRLVLGKWDVQKNEFLELVNEPLSQVTNASDLWEMHCETVRNKMPEEWREQSGPYTYWFRIQDTSPENYGLMHVTDPFAYALDYRVVKDPGQQPAAVIWMDLANNCLLPCDHQAVKPTSAAIDPPGPSRLPTNQELVIYEAPALFIRGSANGQDSAETDIGTFKDAITLFARPSDAVPAAAEAIDGNPYLVALGVNALELTPPADAKPPNDDTKSRQEWGYGTAHYMAPDYQLGYSNCQSTSVEDLSILVQTCHSLGVRFFTDVVMAFGSDPYAHIAFYQFHLIPSDETNNDDSYKFDVPHDANNLRKDWGGRNWRYIKATKTYDPISGTGTDDLCPAVSFHLSHLERWISYYRVDGIRLDSLENVANRDALKLVRDKSHEFFRNRNADDPSQESEARFLVVGEEVQLPEKLISSGTLDGYWNEQFKLRLRNIILGQAYQGEDFGDVVNKTVDCRALGRAFEHGARAINYITSHDTEKDMNQRLYNYLGCHGIEDDQERARRTKMAFAILMTSIGTPMIYAGEEFCDQMDRVAVHPWKQADPVNYGRVQDSWRRDVFDQVSRLVKLRKTNKALWGNEVSFIHWDFTNDRRVMAWVRGGERELPVVVVANFSAVRPEGNEYVLPRRWPTVAEGVKWREVCEGREVSDDWVNREPVYAWEVKVYESYECAKS